MLLQAGELGVFFGSGQIELGPICGEVLVFNPHISLGATVVVVRYPGMPAVIDRPYVDGLEVLSDTLTKSTLWFQIK